MRNNGKGVKAVVTAVLIGLSVLLSACGDGDGGPKLPNDLEGLPIVEGIGKACEVFGCPK